MMDKKAKVDLLINSKQTKWEEADREMLMNTDETVLDKMVPVEDKAAPEVNAEDAPAPALEHASEPKKSATVEEYIANNHVPADMAEIIRNGQAILSQEKAKLMTVITNNKRSTYTKEQLNAMTVEQLKPIAALAVEIINNFSGQGDIEVNVETNAESILMPPVINFEPEPAKKS